MRVATKTKKFYEDMYLNKGEKHLYHFIVGSSFIDNILANKNSDVVLLDRSEAFFALFRQTGNKNYFNIGKILRKAAHKLYREKLRTMKKPRKNNRFLNLVK